MELQIKNYKNYNKINDITILSVLFILLSLIIIPTIYVAGDTTDKKLEANPISTNPNKINKITQLPIFNINYSYKVSNLDGDAGNDTIEFWVNITSTENFNRAVFLVINFFRSNSSREYLDRIYDDFTDIPYTNSTNRYYFWYSQSQSNISMDIAFYYNNNIQFRDNVIWNADIFSLKPNFSYDSYFSNITQNGALIGFKIDLLIDWGDIAIPGVLEVTGLIYKKIGNLFVLNKNFTRLFDVEGDGNTIMQWEETDYVNSDLLIVVVYRYYEEKVGEQSFVWNSIIETPVTDKITTSYQFYVEDRDNDNINETAVTKIFMNWTDGLGDVTIRLFIENLDFKTNVTWEKIIATNKISIYESKVIYKPKDDSDFRFTLQFYNKGQIFYDTKWIWNYQIPNKQVENLIISSSTDTKKANFNYLLPSLLIILMLNYVSRRVDKRN